MQQLRRPDAVEDVHPVPLAPAQANVPGERLAGGDAPAQPAAQVGSRRVGEDAGEQRGHAEEEGGLLLLQERYDRLGRRPIREQHRACPGREREGHCVAQPVGEEQLGGREDEIVGPHAEDALAVQARGLGQVAMEVHGSLGLPGGAARVEPERHVVAGRRRGLQLRPGLCQELVQRHMAGGGSSRDDHRLQEGLPAQGRMELRQESGADHQDAGAAVAQQVLVIGGGEQRVDGHRHQTRFHRSPEHGREIGRIQHAEQHALLQLDAQRLERVPGPVGALAQRAVGGDLPILAERWPVRAGQVSLQQIDRRVVGIPHAGTAYCVSAWTSTWTCACLEWRRVGSRG